MEQRFESEISFEEIIDLSQRLKAEPGGYYRPRLEPEQLASVIRAKMAVFRKFEGRIEAFAALWPTYLESWVEFGTVWVGQGLRGKRLHCQLMAEAMHLVPDGTNACMFSSIGKLMDSAQLLDFQPVTTERHRVLLWASDVGVVQRLPRSIHPDVYSSGVISWEKPRDGVRWLFWRRSDNRAYAA